MGAEEATKEKWTNVNSPLLVVFKDGYDYFAKGNYGFTHDDERKFARRKVHESRWNHRTIKLQKFEGDLEAYYDRLKRMNGSLTTILNRVFGARDCDWQKIPKLMLWYDHYDELLDRAKIPHIGIPSLDVLSRRLACNQYESKEAFIKEHTYDKDIINSRYNFPD